MQKKLYILASIPYSKANNTAQGEQAPCEVAPTGEGIAP